MGSRIIYVFILTVYFYLDFSRANEQTNPTLCCAYDCCTYENITFTYDCVGCSCTSLPLSIPEETRTLLLRNNKIDSLSACAFSKLHKLQHLDLSFNALTKFNVDTFKGLHNLLELNLADNEASCDLGSAAFPAGLFHDLTSLTSLDISLGQRSKRVGKSYPDKALQNLSHLQSLRLPGIRDFHLGHGFSKLSSLRSLVIDCSSRSKIANVGKDSFTSISSLNLIDLDLRNCNIKSMHSKALFPLRNLTTLNLACNPLGMNIVKDIIGNLSTRSLHTLVIDQVSVELSVIKRDYFNPNTSQTLERLSIRKNDIVSGDPDMFLNIPKIRHISFGYNSVLGSSQDSPNSTHLIYMVNKLDVHIIDASNYFQFRGHMFKEKVCYVRNLSTNDFFVEAPDFLRNAVNMEYAKHVVSINKNKSSRINGQMNVPSSVTMIIACNVGLIFSGTIHSNSTINDDNNILLINVSGSTNVNAIQSPIFGFNKLRLLDASNCDISFLGDRMFATFPSLTHVYLQGNKLNKLVVPLNHVLDQAHSVMILNLSTNGIKHLPKDSFIGMTSLEYLYLSGNSLVSISLDIAHLKRLKVLDLSFNLIPYLDPSFISALEKIPNITLDISNNPFICSCESIKFIKWMQQTTTKLPDGYFCQLDKIFVDIKDVDVTKLETTCSRQSHIAQYISVSLAMSCTVSLIVALMYVNRWKIRWHVYLQKRKLRKQLNHFEGIELLDHELHYHAFVSHEHGSEMEWVLNKLLPKAENEWGLRLSLGYRDFKGGVSIQENIVNFIDKSRKTLVLLTPAFVESEWCEFEFNMALTRGIDHVIICYLEDVAPDKMWRSLKKLMAKVNYIPYTADADGQELFWNRLHDALTELNDNDLM